MKISDGPGVQRLIHDEKDDEPKVILQPPHQILMSSINSIFIEGRNSPTTSDQAYEQSNDKQNNYMGSISEHDNVDTNVNLGSTAENGTVFTQKIESAPFCEGSTMSASTNDINQSSINVMNPFASDDMDSNHSINSRRSSHTNTKTEYVKYSDMESEPRDNHVENSEPIDGNDNVDIDDNESTDGISSDAIYVSKIEKDVSYCVDVPTFHSSIVLSESPTKGDNLNNEATDDGVTHQQSVKKSAMEDVDHVDSSSNTESKSLQIPKPFPNVPTAITNAILNIDEFVNETLAGYKTPLVKITSSQKQDIVVGLNEERIEPFDSTKENPSFISSTPFQPLMNGLDDIDSTTVEDVSNNNTTSNEIMESNGVWNIGNEITPDKNGEDAQRYDSISPNLSDGVHVVQPCIKIEFKEENIEYHPSSIASNQDSETSTIAHSEHSGNINLTHDF